MFSTKIRMKIFAAGAATGAAFTLVVVHSNKSNNYSLYERKYGYPESSKVRTMINFVSEVDYKTKNPKWVLEHHVPETPGPASRRGVHYAEDEGIDPRFRARLSDYRGSGFDRGHMSPAYNNKSSADAMEQSFLLSNCAPQVGKGFNQDYWARFERFITDVVRPACKNVHVITGPLYSNAESGQKIGGGVAVPSHFYKVILGELRDANQQHVLGAFVMPNDQIHPKTPLTTFLVPLDQLEREAGIIFFPKMQKQQQQLLLDLNSSITINSNNNTSSITDKVSRSSG